MVRLLGMCCLPRAGRYPPPHGILKENLLWVRTFDTIEELRAALVTGSAAKRAFLFDDFVSAQLELQRHIEAKCSGCL